MCMYMCMCSCVHTRAYKACHFSSFRSQLKCYLSERPILAIPPQLGAPTLLRLSIPVVSFIALIITNVVFCKVPLNRLLSFLGGRDCDCLT